MSASIEKLSTELLQMIAEPLSTVDRFALAMTCRQIKTAIGIRPPGSELELFVGLCYSVKHPNLIIEDGPGSTLDMLSSYVRAKIFQRRHSNQRKALEVSLGRMPDPADMVSDLSWVPSLADRPGHFGFGERRRPIVRLQHYVTQTSTTIENCETYMRPLFEPYFDLSSKPRTLASCYLSVLRRYILTSCFLPGGYIGHRGNHGPSKISFRACRLLQKDVRQLEWLLYGPVLGRSTSSLAFTALAILVPQHTDHEQWMASRRRKNTGQRPV